MPIQLLLKRCSDERSWYFLIQIGNDKTTHVEQDQGGLKSAGKDNTGLVCRSWWHAVLIL